MLAAMKSKLGIGLLLAVGVALTGCAGEASPATPSTTPAEQSPAESSTPKQWASLIAKQQADWVDWKTSWDEANCSSIEATLESGIICRIQFLSAEAMTNTTTIQHELATTPGKPGFIAEEPHTEVAALFESTSAAADEARTAATAWLEAGCELTPTDGCGGLAFALESAIDDLLSEFNAWAPYI